MKKISNSSESIHFRNNESLCFLEEDDETGISNVRTKMDIPNSLRETETVFRNKKICEKITLENFGRSSSDNWTKVFSFDNLVTHEKTNVSDEKDKESTKASKSKKLKNFLPRTFLHFCPSESALDLRSNSSFSFKRLSKDNLRDLTFESVLKPSATAGGFAENEVVKEIIPLNQFPGISIFQIITDEFLSEKRSDLELVIVLPKPFSSHEIEYQLDAVASRQEDKEVATFVWNLCLQRNTNHHSRHSKLKSIINKEMFCPRCQYKKESFLDNVSTYRVKKSSAYKRHLFRPLFKERSKTFSCVLCRSYLSNGKMLIKRLLSKKILEERYKIYKCEVCNCATYRSKREASKHVIEHIASGSVLCSECYSSMFTNSSSMFNVDLLWEQITCSSCKKSYSDANTFLGKWNDLVARVGSSTAKRKIRRSYRCNVCDKKFKGARMEAHLVSHVAENSILCVKCRKNI
ncbi:uncharacterized protein LOC111635848 isoform X2 [Centruroides sculpturatus]|uniref:uncharacterized protein LOC111635848 isoform X2 n=1 Tax=Centruroides sculpturatus TaxID=218467 RepID=UPI000C6DED46|nr:uncharacterized protein LOC111635848 isoform X2 [Centruroides sculpturatus]